MQHLDTYSSCVDALCCISGIAKCPLSKHDNCVTVSYYTIIENREIDGGGVLCLHIIQYLPIYGHIVVHHHIHYLQALL